MHSWSIRAQSLAYAHTNNLYRERTDKILSSEYHRCFWNMNKTLNNLCSVYVLGTCVAGEFICFPFALLVVVFLHMFLYSVFVLLKNGECWFFAVIYCFIYLKNFRKIIFLVYRFLGIAHNESFVAQKIG